MALGDDGEECSSGGNGENGRLWQALDWEDNGVINGGGILSQGGMVMVIERKKMVAGISRRRLDREEALVASQSVTRGPMVMGNPWSGRRWATTGSYSYFKGKTKLRK